MISHFPNWRSVKTQLTLFITAIFLASLWSLSAYVHWALHDDLRKSSGDNLMATVSILASEVNDQVSTRLNALELAALSIPGMMERPKDLQRDLEGRTILQALFNAGTFVTNARGLTIAATPFDLGRTGLQYLERDFVVQALKGNRNIGAPVVGKLLNAPLLVMAVPIRDGSGKVIGALMGATNLGQANFLQKIAETKYGKEGKFLLVSREHKVIITATEKGRVMTPVGGSELAKRHLAGFDGYLVGMSSSGAEVVSAAKGIPAANWYLALNLPTAEAFESINDLQNRLFLATLVLTLVAGALAYWVIGNRLSPLLSATDILKNGAPLGQTLPAELKLPVVRNDEIGSLLGSFNGLLSSLQERETALRKSEEFSRMIANNIPGLLAYWTPDLRCFFANENHQQWFGRSPSEMEGLQMSDLLSKQRFAQRKPYLEAVLSGRSVSFEDSYELINGKTIYALTQYIPRLVGGWVKGFFVLTTDISARHKAELEAKSANELILGAIDAIDEAFVLYDAQDRLVFCNEKYREVYAASADLIVPGATFEEIVRKGAERGEYKAALGRVDEFVAERMATHRAANTDLVQRLDNGRVLRIVERRMPDGQIVGFRIDITDLVLATERAEAANLAKSQFLANMSHEIRTPMNAILGMLRLLQNTELDPRQQDYTSKTEGAAKSLLGLLNDILDFSKIEAGKMEIDLQPFRMDRLLRDLSVIASANVKDKPIEVLYDVDPQVPRDLLGDAMRLQQILINLTGNAIKFTDHGEVVVQIKLLEKADQLCRLRFSVRDSGIGIAPEHLNRIFEGFSQAEASTTRRFGGTGLGLTISRRLVSLMGGELEVQSELGRGSNFHFTLTLTAHSHEAQSAASVAQEELAHLDVLVVDDNPVARELLAGMAESFGWHVDVASDGAQALGQVESHLLAGKPPYQAIFMDWEMPGLDGWQTIERIRKIKSGGKAPITVMVTGRGREMLSSRSAKEQAMLSAFLVKPVTASMLFDAVADARAGRSNVRSRKKAPAGQVQHLQGLHLLLVEDNLINQQVAQELLVQEGAVVEIADNGQLAVQALKEVISQTKQPFDAVLMDLQMPVMDGFEATRAIRNDLGLKDLPVIAMTANAMASDRDACLDAGMNDHVGKPFDLPHLIEVLLGYTQRSGGKVSDAPVRAKPAEHFLGTVTAPSDSLQAIDDRTAIARMGGNSDLYCRSLVAFRADLTTQSDQLHALLQANDLEQAGRLLHTLKGLSSTLGANALASMLRAAETALKSDSAVGLQELAESLRLAMGTTQQALQLLIDQYKAQASKSAPAATPGAPDSQALDLPALREDLQALLTMLRASDMAALDAFSSLRERHGSLDPTLIEPLDAAMANLDFVQAALACDDLARQLAG